ncbi:MAG: response regulator [Saprospiraceae bacterium]
MLYRNILLIDDDEDDQEIFLSAIEHVSEKVNCIVISDATEALQKLIDREIFPDVIFLDLNMPIMNGQQFLTAIKKSPVVNHIPVIIFSTASNARTIALTKELGATGFITKPGTFGELIRILSPLIA